MKLENRKNLNILIATLSILVISSLLFFSLGYLIHNSTTTEIVYKTNYIKPSNATIVVYYYPSAGYNLYSLSIKGENLSLTLNYNYYQQTPNSIINPQSTQSAESIVGINAPITVNNIVPAIIPSSLIKYAAAFTELKPFSYYNITIRYTFAPPCNGICPEASSDFIMAGSESQIIETGANNTVVRVFFSSGPGIRPVISTSNTIQNTT
ncbi:MAG: hypothetical protein ACP5RQ_01740 [Candidatus Micrarchaeia archaeon]